MRPREGAVVTIPRSKRGLKGEYDQNLLDTFHLSFPPPPLLMPCSQPHYNYVSSPMYVISWHYCSPRCPFPLSSLKKNDPPSHSLDLPFSFIVLPAVTTFHWPIWGLFGPWSSQYPPSSLLVTDHYGRDALRIFAALLHSPILTRFVLYSCISRILRVTDAVSPSKLT